MEGIVVSRWYCFVRESTLLCNIFRLNLGSIKNYESVGGNTSIINF